jgi:glutamyl-tRNA reductase
MFRLLSFSNKTANFNENGFFMTDEEARIFLSFLKKTGEISEALVLSVPEQTAILYLADEDKTQMIFSVLKNSKEGLVWPEPGFFQHELDEEKAIVQITELCFGLNSLLYGSVQLFQQFKKAYHLSCREKMAGEFLYRFMQILMESEKRIQNNTNYRKSTISVSYTVVDMIMELVKKINLPKIALVGDGPMCRRLITSLKEKGYSDITIVEASHFPTSNDEEKDQPGYTKVPLSEMDNIVNLNDIVVITTEISEDLIKPDYFSPSISSLKILIDLSVKGNVSQEADDLLYVIRFDMNDIHQIIEDKIEINKKCLRDVKSIIRNQLDSYFIWMGEKRKKNPLRDLMKIFSSNKIAREAINDDILQENTIFQCGALCSDKIQQLLRKSIRKIQLTTENKENLTYKNAVNRLFYHN